MTHDGRFVEVQSTAEQVPSTARGSTSCSTWPRPGVEDLQRFQEEAIAAPRE